MSKISNWWKKLISKIKSWFHKDKGGGGQSGGGSGGGSHGGGGGSAKIDPEWCYGGENGSKAKEDTSANGYKLKSVSFDGKNVKFSGSGNMWGATHGSPTARNCLFFKEGGKWYGGFFEWGSPDRTTRAIANIEGRYKGWQPSRVAAAKEFAFCLMDKASKNRSNFVTCSKSARAVIEAGEVVDVFDPDVIPE